MATKQEHKLMAFTSIEKTTEIKVTNVMTNIIKMLTARGIMDSTKLEHNIRKYSVTADDYLYTIKMDDYKETYGENQPNMIVKFFHQKIGGIAKSSQIGDFLIQYKNIPKIIVVWAIGKKIHNSIQYDFKSPHQPCEIFLEKELLCNIIDNISVPEHILLSENEMKRVFDEYHVKGKRIPKILRDDPITRYFNAKPGQVFRIIRPSETAGKGVSYRLVVNGPMKG